MSLVEVRKFATVVEEVFHEGGPPPARPLKQGACLAVIRNPYAGRYEPDLLPLMKELEPLGLEMARRLIAALGVGPKAIEAYGKGAIVGAAGELEHGALWHAPGGYGMREVLGGTKAIVPSSKKVGGARRAPRRAARPYQCRLRAQPFRRHGTRPARCAQGGRDRLLS